MPNRENTGNVQRHEAKPRQIDCVDRRILGELCADAELSYAELGRRVHLSAAAVHERVKRLRASGCIRRTVAVLDGMQVGKPLLAFVSVETTGWGKSDALMALTALPEVEEMHSVTGETCMLLKVRVADGQALEGLLAMLYGIRGVRRTSTSVVLSTYLERTPGAHITEDLHHVGSAEHVNQSLHAQE